MTISLPTPIDQALLNQRVQEWADALIASYHARYPTNTPSQEYGITVDVLRKYWRIVKTQYGDSRSVHAFLDPKTGDVYKAAGWAAPAKHVRYNLLDDESFARMLDGIDPFGSYLYIR